MPQQHRHEYAAVLPRGLGADDIHGNRVARLPSAHRYPAHIRQIEAGGLALEGRYNTGFLRTPSCLACRATDRLAVPTGLGVVGAACHPSQAVSPGRTAPSFTWLLRQPSSGVLSSPHGSWRLVALDIPRPDLVGAKRHQLGFDARGMVAWRRRSRTSPSARSRRYMV